MIKQHCVRTYDINYSGNSDKTLNSFLEEGWKVIMVTPKSNYNEYIIEKEVEDSEAEYGAQFCK